MGFQLAFNTGFAFSFVSAFFILFYIKERVTRSKLLQFVSGVNIKIYWLISFFYDYAAFVLTILLYLAVLVSFQETGWKTFTEIGRLFGIMLLFAWASLPIIYLASFIFSVPATGFVRLAILFILVGVILFMIVFIMEADLFDLKPVTEVLDWVFLIFPHYSLSRALSNINVISTTESICTDTCANYEGCTQDLVCSIIPDCCDIPSVMSFGPGGIGKNIVSLAILGFVFFVVLFMVEYRALNWIVYKKKPPSNIPETEDDVMDSDVRAEKDRIQNMSQMDISHHNLVLRNVTKFYNNLRAVNQLCVGVDQGECFGLLGMW